MERIQVMTCNITIQLYLYLGRLMGWNMSSTQNLLFHRLISTLLVLHHNFVSVFLHFVVVVVVAVVVLSCGLSNYVLPLCFYLGGYSLSFVHG